MIYRVFVEKKENLQAKKIREDLDAQLGIAVEDLREVIRYDAEGISEAELEAAVVNVFSEPPVDNVWREELPVAAGYKVFAIAFLDGQYAAFGVAADEESVLTAIEISKTPTRSVGYYDDVPVTPVAIKTVKIRRGGKDE